MKGRLLVLGTVLMAAGAASWYFLRGDSIPWQEDYRQALQEARSRGVPLIAYFYTDWCTLCARMKAETFQEPTLIREMGSRYVWLRINAEQGEGVQLRQRYQITGYPTFVVLDEEGQELDRLQGFLAASDFQNKIQQLVRDPESLGRLLRKAQQEGPSSSLEFKLASRYLERGDFANASRHFRKVIELAGPADEARLEASRYYLAYSLASLGNGEEAVAQLRKLQEVDPSSSFIPDALLLQGQIQYYTGRGEEARKTLKAFLDRFPQHRYRPQVERLLLEIGSDLPVARAH